MKKAMVLIVVLSLLFLGVPTPTNAGVVAGAATEWTQILNHVQLIMGYIRQGLQLENELKQYAEQLKQGRVFATTALLVLSSRIYPSSHKSFKVDKPWRIRWAISMRSFAIRFPGYSFRTSGYFNDYKKWSQTSLDTTMNSLRAVGLQGQQLNNAQTVLAQLRHDVHGCRRADAGGGGGEPDCRTAGGTIDGASPV